jgi:glycosyltransferase involved in cell wall biosynthesis
VTNLCTHYRRPLFAALARWVELDVYLTSRGAEWYWPQEQELPGPLPGMHRTPTSWSLMRALVRGRHECVVASLTGRGTLLAAFLYARVARVPFVLWVGIWSHPETLFHRISRPVTRSLFRNADALVVYGSHVAAYVEQESGRSDRIFVAVQSVENKLFRDGEPAFARVARGLRAGVLEACFVGRLEPEKGLDILVRALSLTPEGITLTVVGSGGAEPELAALAESLGVSDRVRFAGRISQEKLPGLLRSADCLILPSVSTPRVRETWGLVVNEAMNCGLPVIASDAVGAAAGGLVVNGETGLVVPERDPAALAVALEALADDPDRRAAMGRAAFARVLDWNVEAAADAFVQALSIGPIHRVRTPDDARPARA